MVSRRELLRSAAASAILFVADSACRLPQLNPEENLLWKEKLREQGKRVDKDIAEIGLEGDLRLVRFEALSPETQRRLGIAPQTTGFFSFHPQPEDYILTRFVIETTTNQTPVIVGISTKKEPVTIEEDNRLSKPTAQLEFDNSKFLEYYSSEILRKRADLRPGTHPEVSGTRDGAFRKNSYKDPQAYVRPRETDGAGRILRVHFKGPSEFVTLVNQQLLQR